MLPLRHTLAPSTLAPSTLAPSTLAPSTLAHSPPHSSSERAGSKQQSIDQVLTRIERNFGPGSLMRLGATKSLKVAAIPTGALPLDIAMGGGFPKGRITEIYGPESCGKTTLALHAIASVQAQGGNAVFIDAEHALDTTYAAAIGVDIDNLVVAQPDCGETALEIADQLIRSAAIDIVVIDSVAALVPQAELEGEMGESHMGLQARLMSQALRKMAGSLSKTGCTLIFLNQLRQKIGVIYGSPEVTTGGNALKFYASVRLDIRRMQVLKRGGEQFGMRVKTKTAKNKVAPPFRTAEFDILFGKGISEIGCLLDLAEQTRIVERRGAWYRYEGENFAQGRENAVVYLEQTPLFKQRLTDEVRANLERTAP